MRIHIDTHFVARKPLNANSNPFLSKISFSRINNLYFLLVYILELKAKLLMDYPVIVGYEILLFYLYGCGSANTKSTEDIKRVFNRGRFRCGFRDGKILDCLIYLLLLVYNNLKSLLFRDWPHYATAEHLCGEDGIHSCI